MEVKNSFPVFLDRKGKPLDNGYIYIGKQNQHPIVSPQQAYWDADLTIPADDIRTTKGYASRSGAPAQLYTNEPYSILVRDSAGVEVYLRYVATSSEQDTVLTESGEEYLLSNSTPEVNLVVGPSAIGARITQDQGKVITRGLSDLTTPGSSGYLALRPGQSLKLTRLEGGSVEYTGALLKVNGPAILAELGQDGGWSPDGRYLAVGHVGPPFVTIYDWSTGFPVKVADPLILPPGAGNGASWSPDGRYLAVAHTTSPYVTIYDWSSGSPVKVADPAPLPTGNGQSVAWSPNGRYLTVGHSTSPHVAIYDWSSGIPVKVADPAALPPGQTNSASWSPDGRYLALANTTSSPYITIYDWSSGGPVKVADPATLPTGIGYGIGWSPDGRYLAISHSSAPNVTIYDWSSGSPVKIADPDTLPPGTPRELTWSPDGRYLAIANSLTPFLTVYDWSSGVPAKIADPATLPPGAANDASWSPDGKYVTILHFDIPYITIYQTTETVFDPWAVRLIDGPEIRPSDFV